MAPRLRVLLVSPVRKLDPPNGDVTYTELLLANAPAEIEYETYDAALAAGRLKEYGRRVGGRIPRDMRGLSALAVQAGVNALRRKEILFREPFRHFSVEPGHYDLVHVHVFGVHWLGPTPPIVLSNGAPQPDMYRHVEHWSEPRVRWALTADAGLAALTRVDQPIVRVRRADAVVLFTEHLRAYYEAHRVAPGKPMHVVACPVDPAPRVTQGRTPRTVGFVARDFAAKGGDTLLTAWPRIKAGRPDARLVIAGSDDKPASLPDGVIWMGRVSRDDLMAKFYPAIDVFAYPTNFDGGSLVVQEILAHGIPAVVSDFGPMPEMVGWGRAGAVVPRRDPHALVEACLGLLEEDRHRAAAHGAAAWFDERFSSTSVIRRLNEIYATTAGLNSAA